MAPLLTCPACNASDIDVRTYDSMMVLRPDFALFTITCPHCATKISSLQPVPPSLREEVNFAAIELNAGMGRTEEAS